ncbi:MAG: erythromycin esterase family protein [bacterium]
MARNTDDLVRMDVGYLVQELENNAHDLNMSMDKLMEEIGDARFVLLGEASHGTHEYYIWRARISQKLIKEKNFSFIAVEGDWPDCYKINRFIKGYEDAGEKASDVLKEFKRWPTWMWSNWEIAALTEWLRMYNNDLPSEKKIGFYGLDVYSLWESLESIAKYMKFNDPEAYETTLKAMNCFESMGLGNEKDIAFSSLTPRSCREKVVKLLNEIQSKMITYNTDLEAPFNAEQNALVTLNAEKYYNAMISGGISSWNIRDSHMMETLNRLMKFHGKDAKCIVWEHNTHIGDARETDMASSGLYNLGQLAREQHKKEDVKLIGFGSYRGSLIAADQWEGKMKKKEAPPARINSWEEILHQVTPADKYFLSKEINQLTGLHEYLDHRAIGVVYHPGREKFGNYVPTLIPRRYDAFIFLDETTPLHPMDIEPAGQLVPQTYPWEL